MFKRFLLIVCLLAPLGAQAAFDPNGISMTASVNKTSITLEDELTLTVTVDGAAGDFMPQLPSLPAFNVYARSAAKQINDFHAVSTFEYVMLPRFPGKAVIGPITLNYGNKIYRTEPITVTVYRANQTAKTKARGNVDTGVKQQPRPAKPTQAPANMPPLERDLYNRAARSGDKDYFMAAAVSNASPYVNQTVTLAVRFYFSRPFVDNAPFTAPSITNLFMEELPLSEGRQTIGGKTYSYIEKRYAISGVTAGKAQVGPASVKYIPSGRLDLSVFDRMFAVMAQDADTVQSNAISLTVRPVPAEDKPKSFYGAVGTGYTISASADRDEVEAGEAVNLTIKVNGPGNLKPTSDLKLPVLPGFKVYDVASTAGAVNANGELKSYKIFKTVIVPSSSGTYTVPALAWSYFDPAAKEYRTIHTRPLDIKVTPSSKTDTGFDFGAHTDLGGGFRQLGQDIRYLKSDVADAELTFFAKLAAMSFVNYLFITLLVFAGLFALADKQTLAGKRALAKARASLKKAWSEEAVADALSTYLQVRYGVHTASLPLRDISAALKKRGCPAPLIQQFETLWQRLDAARFAPVDLQGEGADGLARQAAALMKAMDKGGRK